MALEVPDFDTVDPKALEVWDEEEDIVSRVLRAKQLLGGRAGEVARALATRQLPTSTEDDPQDAADAVPACLPSPRLQDWVAML